MRPTRLSIQPLCILALSACTLPDVRVGPSTSAEGQQRSPADAGDHNDSSDDSTADSSARESASRADAASTPTDKEDAGDGRSKDEASGADAGASRSQEDAGLQADRGGAAEQTEPSTGGDSADAPTRCSGAECATSTSAPEECAQAGVDVFDCCPGLAEEYGRALACDPYTNCGCKKGEACYVSNNGVTASATCYREGTTPHGQACSHDHRYCAGGSSCNDGVCSPYCDPRDPTTCSGDCIATAAVNLGYCFDTCNYPSDLLCASGLTCAQFGICINPWPTCDFHKNNGTCDGPSGSRYCLNDEDDPDCASLACTSDYKTWPDESKVIQISAPVAWTNVVGDGWNHHPFSGLPELLGPGMNVATNVPDWFTNPSTPGVFVGASLHLPKMFTPEQVIARYAFSDCQSGSVNDVTFAGYTGKQVEWSCPEGSSWWLATVWPADHSFIVVSQGKDVAACNRTNMEHIMNEIQVEPADLWPEKFR